MTTTDNKDAALELAKECGFSATQNFQLRDVYLAFPNEVIALYNDARKPLEEDIEGLLKDTQSLANDLHKTEQQLLATQEAYQRVAEALREFMLMTSRLNPAYDKAEEALANPPSLEAVERKKLEDEIAVLEDVQSLEPVSDTHFRVGAMIAERKAKLEKMK